MENPHWATHLLGSQPVPCPSVLQATNLSGQEAGARRQAGLGFHARQRHPDQYGALQHCDQCLRGQSAWCPAARTSPSHIDHIDTQIIQILDMYL